MRKRNWIRFLKVVALLVPIISFVLFMPTNDSDDTRRIKNFYLEEPNSLDVIVMGASDVYAGYSPILAYEEYGFTSYPYVLSGNFIHLFQAQLEQIHMVQDPKLIVIEITEAVKEWDNYDTIFRQYVAGVPFSKHKVNMIKELGNPEQILSYYIPFSIYHGNADLEMLIQNAKTEALVQERGYSLLKGTWTFTGTGENWDGEYVTPINTTNDNSKAEIPQVVAENFHRFLTYCREHNYNNIVFVNFPQRRSGEAAYLNYQICNSVGDLIESYGYDYLNFEGMLDQIGIQPETDFYNNDHLNLYGQYKTTRFLCDILVKDYGIEKTQLSQENKEKWENCVEYGHLYYDLFEYEYSTKEPDEFGLFLKEDSWLVEKLNEMKASGLSAKDIS